MPGWTNIDRALLGSAFVNELQGADDLNYEVSKRSFVMGTHDRVYAVLGRVVLYVLVGLVLGGVCISGYGCYSKYAQRRDQQYRALVRCPNCSPGWCVFTWLDKGKAVTDSMCPWCGVRPLVSCHRYKE